MPPGSPALSLTGTERQALMTPTEASNTTVVCLNRNGGGEEQVGPVFAVRPALTYALSSDAVTGVPFDVAVTGIATFDALDEVRLHRDTCAGGPVSGTDRVRRSASEVRVTFTAAEAHAAVAVCITRRCAKCVGGRTPAAEVGTPFPIGAMTYALNFAEVAQDIEFTVTLSGVSDFDAEDRVGLRVASCAGPAVRTSSSALSRTGGGRVLTVTAAQNTPDAVVCLTRGPRPTAQIGAAFPIRALTATRLPGAVTAGLHFTLTIAGLTTFDAATDAVRFRRGTCAGAAVAGADPAVTGGGAVLRAVFRPEEAAASVRACLRRRGGPEGGVGPLFDIDPALQTAVVPAQVASLVSVRGSRAALLPRPLRLWPCLPPPLPLPPPTGGGRGPPPPPGWGCPLGRRWPAVRACLLRVDPTRGSETGTVRGLRWHTLRREGEGGVGEVRIGQTRRGRARGGERLMGTAASGGRGFKGRARVTGERPNRRRPLQTATQPGVMPTPPPPWPPTQLQSSKATSASVGCWRDVPVCAVGRSGPTERTWATGGAPVGE